MTRSRKGWPGPHLEQQKRSRNDALRAEYRAGVPGTKLAAKYGITRTRVYQLCRGLRKGKP